jgi:ankyrin repeat protein
MSERTAGEGPQRFVRGGTEQEVILHAALIGCYELVKDILARSPSLATVSGVDGMTPLHQAARGGAEKVVGLLIESGADVSATDKFGRTPLHSMVATSTNIGIINRLLEAGADINAKDAAGNTVLFNTSQCANCRHDWGAHWEVSDYLQKSGASVDICTAIAKDDRVQVAALLDSDPSLINAPQGIATNPDGKTPLHHAADRGRSEIIQTLLDRGAEPNTRDSRGRPPLYLTNGVSYKLNSAMDSFTKPSSSTTNPCH